MKKAAIVGAGLGGLTMGALLARDGWQVTVFDKNQKVGGVCALAEQNGFKWEQGPLILGDMLPGESVHTLLRELGIMLDVKRAERGIEMPNYTMWRPKEYQGPYWRRERLKQLFPEDRRGIDEYYRFYDDMVRLRYLGGLKPTLINKLRLALAYNKVKDYADMNAQQLVDYFFKNDKIKALFTGILCDFCASPEEAQAFTVPFTNFEPAFDMRIPLEKHGKLYNPGYVNVVGGVQKIPEALAKVITDHGGEIRLNTIVSRVMVENGCAKGVTLENGESVQADLVIGSGGGRDFFGRTVGLENLDEKYIDIIRNFRPMEAVFMVHLGVDYDPMQFMQAPLCYYYKTYDIAGAVRQMRKGIYHEGNDGYLIYIDSAHAPEFAPEGKHCVTIYTVAPDKPINGDWEKDKQRWADHLIELAESTLPELSKHIVEKMIVTAVDYRRMTHMVKSSFGGTVPVMGIQNPPHKTPVRNLWFVGQQSENAGGVGAVMLGAKRAFEQMKENG